MLCVNRPLALRDQHCKLFYSQTIESKIILKIQMFSKLANLCRPAFFPPTSPAFPLLSYSRRSSTNSYPQIDKVTQQQSCRSQIDISVPFSFPSSMRPESNGQAYTMSYYLKSHFLQIKSLLVISKDHYYLNY